MAKRTRTKKLTLIYKTLHRKSKLTNMKPHTNVGVKSGASEVQAFLAPSDCFTRGTCHVPIAVDTCHVTIAVDTCHVTITVEHHLCLSFGMPS